MNEHDISYEDHSYFEKNRVFEKIVLSPANNSALNEKINEFNESEKQVLNLLLDNPCQVVDLSEQSSYRVLVSRISQKLTFLGLNDVQVFSVSNRKGMYFLADKNQSSSVAEVMFMEPAVNTKIFRPELMKLISLVTISDRGAQPMFSLIEAQIISTIAQSKARYFSLVELTNDNEEFTETFHGSVRVHIGNVSKKLNALGLSSVTVAMREGCIVYIDSQEEVTAKNRFELNLVPLVFREKLKMFPKGLVNVLFGVDLNKMAIFTEEERYFCIDLLEVYPLPIKTQNNPSIFSKVSVIKKKLEKYKQEFSVSIITYNEIGYAIYFQSEEPGTKIVLTERQKELLKSYPSELIDFCFGIQEDGRARFRDTEKKILIKLLVNKEILLSSSQLGLTSSLSRVHIYRLRKKLSEYSGPGKIVIKNESLSGYKLIFEE